jgi:hypothetical protein
LVSARVTPATERNRDGERVDRDRRGPVGDHWLFRGEANVFLFHACRSFRNRQRTGGGGFNSFTAQIVGCRKSPRTVGNYAHAEAERFGVGGMAHFAIFGGQGPAAIVHDARVSKGRTALHCRIERPAEDLFHREKLNLTRTGGSAACAIVTRVAR